MTNSDLWDDVLSIAQQMRRIDIAGDSYRRLPTALPCTECGCAAGSLHAFLCALERCPRCMALVLTCECRADRDDG